MLEVKNLTLQYKKKGFRVEDVNFQLDDGYFAVLLGTNGAGKTTLLRGIYQLYHAKQGEVWWNGEKVAKNNLHSYRSDVAYIEDGNWCLGWQCAKDNVELLKDIYGNFDETAFYEHLEQFDFRENLLEQQYDSLSKGEQMKVQIAFALARHPKLILADEPFANLDPVMKTDLVEALHQQVMNEEMSVLLSTHLVEDITDITDYIGMMEAGKMTAFGDRETMLEQYHSHNLREMFRQQ